MKKYFFLLLMLCSVYGQAQDSLLFVGKRVIISNAGIRRPYPLVNLSYFPTFSGKYQIKVDKETIFNNILANLYMAGANTIAQKIAVLDIKIDESLSSGSGTNGSTIRNGTGAPDNAIGVDGDYYLDNFFPNNLYKRVVGVYVLQTSLSTSYYQINTKTAAYTLLLSDANKIIEMDAVTATNVTIPTDATASYPIGTMITILQYNVGQVSIVAANGVTILSSSNRLKLAGQYSLCTIIKKSTNQWYLSGDLTL